MACLVETSAAINQNGWRRASQVVFDAVNRTYDQLNTTTFDDRFKCDSRFCIFHLCKWIISLFMNFYFVIYFTYLLGALFACIISILALSLSMIIGNFNASNKTLRINKNKNY